MPIATNATASMQACIDACNSCFQACEECYTACLNEPDVQARIHCIQVLRDCADICAMASQYMSRNIRRLDLLEKSSRVLNTTPKYTKT
ncbi:four-helix bundle copper-binding protein [Desulfosporosinus nitroreducens]|uniref:four-helix bundle copper-binding protein n=1 Tax=Desulfosporosinus nitroreducens TaxID=2018668 RepID=UPI00207CFBCA|nr:four-helix bundle copper-binding protein [Desulfosporosinus nitroreducens]MCO1602109.1 four-helix bundle copper-binding protein [Desulfosporosinus nitroreducens]